MLADSEHHNECNHSQNWVTVGKTKTNMGGVKWVSNPCVNRNDNILSTSLMQNAPTHQNRDPHL